MTIEELLIFADKTKMDLRIEVDSIVLRVLRVGLPGIFRLSDTQTGESLYRGNNASDAQAVFVTAIGADRYNDHPQAATRAAGSGIA